MHSIYSTASTLKLKATLSNQTRCNETTNLGLCLCVAQDEMARAQVVILHGHQLAANHHYALALIVQRCNELRHLCDIVTTAIRAKRASLTRARDLLLRLEGVRRTHPDTHSTEYTKNQTCSIVF